MAIRIVKEKITLAELQRLAEECYGDLVKAAVDVENGIMAVGGELHTDEEEVLTEQGSKPQNIWGINIYPSKPKEERIEFDSVINLKPAFGNRSRGIDDPKVRERIMEIVNNLLAE